MNYVAREFYRCGCVCNDGNPEGRQTRPKRVADAKTFHVIFCVSTV
jgi:hypothetical protein